MTRLFRNGRTETVRSLSQEADQFVTAFLNPSRPDEEKRDLLKAACERHATMYKDAMNGMGIDRHLFALYVASRGMGVVNAHMFFFIIILVYSPLDKSTRDKSMSSKVAKFLICMRAISYERQNQCGMQSYSIRNIS